MLGELPDLPYLPEVPGRGAGRVHDRPGAGGDGRARCRPAARRLAAHRRARHRPPPGPQPAAQDLDALEEQAQGFAGAFKVQVAGPWTLAATVERPRGDKVLADFGARRELAQALAEGLATTSPTCAAGCRARTGWWCRSTSRRWPRCWPGAVPTASGFGRHRTVAPARGLARRSAGCSTRSARRAPSRWVHSCAAGHAARPAPGRRRRAGSRSTSTQLSAPRPRRARRGAGGGADGRAGRRAVDRAGDGRRPTTQVTESVLRWLDMLGLDLDELGDRLVLTPACGLAGASPAWARTRTAAAAPRPPRSSPDALTVECASRRGQPQRAADGSWWLAVRRRRARPPDRRWPAPRASR